MAISSYSTVTDKFATLTKMQDENLNEKNRTQKYSGKIGLSVDDVGKYSVTHKDITNILAGDSQSFLKRSLWEFILDLFPMYHIKEAKQAIIDFVSETGDKADIFNKIKSLADQDQQWRFNATTEFIVDENKELFFQLDTRAKAQTQTILPMIEQGFLQLDIKTEDLSCIAFSRGPGSFSGVRINAAVTQALAWSNDLPVVPVSSRRAIDGMVTAFFHPGSGAACRMRRHP